MQVLAELQELVDYRGRHFGDAPPPPILALGLSSRKNLCIHPHVAEEGARESVDAKCMRLTAPWVRERAARRGGSGGGGGGGGSAEGGGSEADLARDVEDLGGEVPTCSFYEGLEGAGPDGKLEAGEAGRGGGGEGRGGEGRGGGPRTPVNRRRGSPLAPPSGGLPAGGLTRGLCPPPQPPPHPTPAPPYHHTRYGQASTRCTTCGRWGARRAGALTS